jgi:hypothetical protein
MKFGIPGLITAMLFCTTPLMATEVVVREFRGLGQTETEAFYVLSPWLVEWWSRPQTAIDHKPAHLEVYLYDASKNEFVGRVAEHAGVGHGEMLIEQGGRFRFRVHGQATHWELKVIKIDEEFAERLRETRPKPAEPRHRLGW